MKKKTKRESKTTLSEKYGDWILMTPPVKELTYVLWFAPIIIMVIGLVVIFRRKNDVLSMQTSNQNFGVFFSDFSATSNRKTCVQQCQPSKNSVKPMVF